MGETRDWKKKLRGRIVSFCTWPFLFMLDCVYPNAMDQLPLLFVLYGMGLVVTLGMMAVMRDVEDIGREVIIFSGIFISGIMIPSPKMVTCTMVTGTCEDRALEKVVKMRAGVESYAKAHDGKRVEEVFALSREGHLKGIPRLWQNGCGEGAHAENRRVRIVTTPEAGDSGEWALILPEDPAAPAEVRIDCTHTSPSGFRWSDF